MFRRCWVVLFLLLCDISMSWIVLCCNMLEVVILWYNDTKLSIARVCMYWWKALWNLEMLIRCHLQWHVWFLWRLFRILLSICFLVLSPFFCILSLICRSGLVYGYDEAIDPCYIELCQWILLVRLLFVVFVISDRLYSFWWIWTNAFCAYFVSKVYHFFFHNLYFIRFCTEPSFF